MPDPLDDGMHFGEGEGETVLDRPIAGRPQILAPQANDPKLQAPAVTKVKRSRIGPILVIFLLIAVAVVAALAGIYSQFGRSDSATTPTPTASTSVPTTQASATTVPTTIDPDALQVVITEDPFICDGESRTVGLLSGTEPNEEIAFSSPQAESLLSGQADADGTLPIRWQCDADQIGETWNLTAAGVTSGKVALFVITGAAVGSENENETSLSITGTPDETIIADSAAPETPAPAGGDLVATIVQDPFICNSQAREFGTLSGAEPNEEIAFTSPQASGIGSGNADANGERPIRWSCDPEQVGTVWELTATGQTSGRSVTFSFTGG